MYIFVKMPVVKAFQLLEINIISAQDLEPVSKKMKTFATAWVHPTRKLSTRVDTEGNMNPNWNDKFVFRVDDEFVKTDTSAVMIEIYATGRGRWRKDALVGTVRVLVGNLIPPQARPNQRHNPHIGTRFVALQVRRPSGRPQGILNVGVSLLDSTMRSMPLYRQLSASAVGFHDLLKLEDDDNPQNHDKKPVKNGNKNQAPAVKPILRRSRSERSERVTFDNASSAVNSSMVAFPKGGSKLGSSMLSSEFVEPVPLKIKGKKGKASSVISGAELKKKPKRGRKKGSSVLSDSIIGRDCVIDDLIFANPIPIKIGPGNKIKFPNEKDEARKPTTKLVEEKLSKKKTKKLGLGVKPTSKHHSQGNENGGGPKHSKFLFAPPPKAGSVLDSEIGPSASEVAANIAQRKYPLDDDNKSSMLDGWSMDESVEGLRSKLERWRTELPPLYDRGAHSSSSFRSNSQQTRQHSDGGETGLFSCFGNFYGYECQCICGRPPSKETQSYHFPSP